MLCRIRTGEGGVPPRVSGCWQDGKGAGPDLLPGKCTSVEKKGCLCRAEAMVIAMKAVVTVIGKDRVGISADVCALLARMNVNILDISQTVMKEFFTMTMLVDTATSEVPFEAIKEALRDKGEEMELSIRIQREDIFSAMHKI